MYTLHYIVPFIIYFIRSKHFDKVKDKVMLFGLLAGNLMDLDHVPSRVIGHREILKSACEEGFGTQCSFGTYALHSWEFAIALVVTIGLLYLFRKTFVKKHISFGIGIWLAIGALLNMLLDLIHLWIGFGI